MSEGSHRQAPQSFSSDDYQVALLKHLAMTNDPSRIRAPGSQMNSLLLSAATDSMLGRSSSQLSMPPLTASSALDYVHASFPTSKLPKFLLDRMPDSSRPPLAENELDGTLSMPKCADQVPMLSSERATAMNSVSASFTMPERLPSDILLGAKLPSLSEFEFDAALSMPRSFVQLPVPPRASETAAAMDRVYASFAMPERLPSDIMLDAALSRLNENEVNIVLQQLLVTRQERQQRSLQRERQLGEMLMQQLRGQVAASLSQALALEALTTPAVLTNQESLQRTSLWRPDRVSFPAESESLLSQAFRSESASFTIQDQNRALFPAQPLALALVDSDNALPGRLATTQEVDMLCSLQGEAPLGGRRRKRKHKGETFPVILHRLLLDVESLGSQSIISFTPSGSAFRVHQPDLFMKEIAPKYFRQQFFSSFTRQLNTYGFDKLASWPDEGGFAHAQFQREKPELCKYINAREPDDSRDKRNPLNQDGDDV
jgi:hypothetical protein